MRAGTQSCLYIEITSINGIERPVKPGKRKSDTYTSLLAVVEYRQATIGHESQHSERYAEASHIISEM